MKDMSKKTQNVNTSAESVHESDIFIHEPWDTSDMAHRAGGLSMEQEPYCWVQSKLVQGTFYKEKPRRIHTIPLYTAPPSKPWVSLSDEDITRATGEVYGNIFKAPQKTLSFARAIEAKLKEKNT